MIHIPSINAVYTGCPKCGTTWMRRALVLANIGAQPIGREHDAAQEARTTIATNVNIFTTVREPLSWYKSFWSDRQFTGWGGDLSIGHSCASPRFDEFLMKVMAVHKTFLSDLYQRFLGESGVALQLERMPHSLVQWLVSRGIDWALEDRPKVWNLPPMNPSATLFDFDPVLDLQYDLLLRSMDKRAYEIWESAR